MQLRFSPNQVDYQKLSTEDLRAAFLINSLFALGKIELVYSDADRAVIGSVVPVETSLTLSADAQLRAIYFCERRELGILNIGGDGVIIADGVHFEMSKLDCLYVARGTQTLIFESKTPAQPAAYYLLSYPAHTIHPTTHASVKDAASAVVGTQAEANRRTIYKYIHPSGIKSCQLVLGFTRLEEGSVWNTMPAHTHARRSEIYLYFDLDSKRRVIHLMGVPESTRHLVVACHQAIISPSWSIHAGCGTGSYSYCWGMGGENQMFEDMDAVREDQMR